MSDLSASYHSVEKYLICQERLKLPIPSPILDLFLRGYVAAIRAQPDARKVGPRDIMFDWVSGDVTINTSRSALRDGFSLLSMVAGHGPRTKIRQRYQIADIELDKGRQTLRRAASSNSEALRKIEDRVPYADRVKFESLRWTHNTPLSIGLRMLSGEITRLRCCTTDDNGREKPFGRGVQFRWGLDSQYGDMCLVMNPSFEKNYSRGVDPSLLRFTDHVVVTDYWTGDQMKPSQAHLQMKHEAGSYWYRPPYNSTMGLHAGQPAPLFKNCNSKEREHFTWCNLQMHVGQDVSFDDVEKVLLPSYVQDLPLYERLLNSAPKQLIDKIVFIGSKSEQFYAWISPDLLHEAPYTSLDRDLPTSPQDKRKAIREGVLREDVLYGNSAKMALSPQVFSDYQEAYMKMLVK